MSQTNEERWAAVTPKKRSKYGVAPKEDRTWRGKVYASKIEMEYAQMLAAATFVVDVVEQPRIRLGDDHIYVPDFLVIGKCGHANYYVDVKGVETPTFRKSKKLWAKYGRLPLHIWKKGHDVEVIEGAKK
jgi:predicted nuclease of restriction endonuclease-like RecB superfamily